MQILLDVDGVLADFIGAVCAETRIPREQITNYNIDSCMPKQESMIVRDAMLSKEFWTSLDPMPEATEATRKLCEDGHDIVVLTRPYPGCYGWVDARLWWLDQNMPWIRPENVIPTSRKELVRGDVHVNDCAAELERWYDVNTGKLAITYAAAYNNGRFTWERFLDSGGNFTTGEFFQATREGALI